VATARKHPDRSDPLLTVADITKWGIRGTATGPAANDPVNEATVARVVAWIEAHCVPLPHIRRSARPRRGPVSSYGWKHAAESPEGGLGRYVANGEFIVAALRAGYRAVQTQPGSPNAFFNMCLRPSRPTAGRTCTERTAHAAPAPCVAARPLPETHDGSQAVHVRPTRDGRARVYVVAPSRTAPDRSPPG
jgi:hypothetical protein